ncbi:hypothetical protein [Sphingomonas solaris]|uniref:Uncharacterized protein n=1 Tax=Alterirhizorhabdus solaris TaxID=2529389 RepID=A0A558QZU8_9SPHN|nr:hypothetical protein [Sphingomonas solaris]TVV72629.1 hypothetical protein FOY91_13970 [Sphingomonas solaris]
MVTRTIDNPTLESLLIQALNGSDRLGYDQVAVHVATAIDALRREVTRSRPRSAAPTLYHMAGRG